MERIFRHRLILKKREEAISMSYHDSLKYLKQEFLKKLPLASLGKRHKFSFGPALPFGYLSDAEYVDIYLSKRMDVEECKKNSFLKDGYFEILSIKTIPIFFPSIDSSIDVIEYEILFEDILPYIDTINKEMKNDFLIFKEDETEIKLNLKEFLFKYEIDKKRGILKLLINYRLGKTLRPDNILKSIGLSLDLVKIIRKKIYWLDSKKKLIEL